MTISLNHVNDTITILNATTGANTANNLGGVGTLNVSSGFAVTPAIGVNGNYIKNYYPDVNSPTSELYGIFPSFNIKFVNGAYSYSGLDPINIYDGSSGILARIGFQVGTSSAGDPKLSTTSGGSFIINTGQATSTTSNVNGDFVVRTRGTTRFRLSANGETYILGNTTTITGITTSNSNTTGTLVVTGGVGIQGNLYTGGVYITGTSNGITFADGTTQTTARPRVTSATSASSLTPSVGTADVYAYTALAAGLTINAPTGTPVDGDKLMFRLLDNGSAQTLTWNATYTIIGVTLPTTTTANKTTYVGCIYNANNTRWDVITVTTQA